MVESEFATILGAALGTAVTFLLGGWLVFRRVRPWVHVMDDLVGEDARPGRDRQPGLLERMRTTENLVALTAEEANAAKMSAWRTEELLTNQAANLKARQRVFELNDDAFRKAVEDAGISVPDRVPFPPVLPDAGDDPPLRRFDDA